MPIDPRTRVCPPPGIYRNVPAAHYHGWKAVSSGRLRLMISESAEHAHYDVENPIEASDDMVDGSYMHALVLQEEIFPELYELRPEGNANSKDFKRRRDRILAERPYVTLIESARWDRLQACGRKLKGHELVASALDTDDRELSIVWVDPQTGLTCKARLDAPQKGIGIWDLKKSRDPRPFAWGRDAWKMRLDLQAAFYLRAAFAAELDVPQEFGFIAFKAKPPFGIRIYDFHGEASKVLTAAEDEISRLLDRWAEHEASGIWPGYPTHIEPFPAPAHAMRQIEEEILEMEEAA
jgi:hypothetical protein